MDRPTTRQLEAFDMIVRAGSARAAGEAMGLPQAEVSRAFRELEAILGVSLFMRLPSGKVRLSDAGSAAIEGARSILADCEGLVAAMAGYEATGTRRPSPAVAQSPEAEPVLAPETDIQPDARTAAADAAPAFEPERECEPEPEPNPDTGTVRAPAQPEAPALILEPPAPQAFAQEARAAPRGETPIGDEGDRPITIGTNAAILSRFQERIAVFEDAFPDRPVTIDFNCFTADRVALALSEGRIAVAYYYAMGESRLFPSDLLWSERWGFFVAPDHRLAERDLIAHEDLLFEQLIGFAPGNRLRPLLDASLADAGLGGLPFLLESDDYAQLVQRAREGRGVLPLFGASTRIAANGGLKRLAFADPVMPVEVRRAVHPAYADDIEVQTLVELLENPD